MNKQSNFLFLLFLLVAPFVVLNANRAYPIQFGIPEEKIVTEIPQKTQDFAYIIPGELSTYIFTEEKDYYADYQRSYFALTKKKGGWDCMRHYEILANGCIPYFLDLDKCDPYTMQFLPRELIKEAMELPGVSYLQINHRVFDKARYFEILGKLLDHTRKFLTTGAIANYILKTVNYQGSGKILFLSNDVSPDYLRCCLLAGFKKILGDRIIDYPKVPHIYKSYPDDIKNLYGKGFSYTKVVDDLPIDRENIEQRIRNREFDLVIYGSVHRGLKFLDVVRQHYSPEQVIYLCGEDAHICEYSRLSHLMPNLFLREFEDTYFRK